MTLMKAISISSPYCETSLTSTLCFKCKAERYCLALSYWGKKGVSPKVKYDIAWLGATPSFLEKHIALSLAFPGHNICQSSTLVLRICWICLALQNQRIAVSPAAHGQNAALLLQGPVLRSPTVNAKVAACLQAKSFLSYQYPNPAK